jgi:hypothetical protein
MCYHFDSDTDTADQSDASDQGYGGAGQDTKLVYETRLAAPFRPDVVTTLRVAAEPEGDGWRVVVTPESDLGRPKTFQVDAARDHDDVRAFVDGIVKSFANPYDRADVGEALAYRMGLGSRALSAVCARFEAKDLTEY